MENPGTSSGLQKDASVVVDDKDYCVQYMKNFDWNAKPLKRTAADSPWIARQDWTHSFAIKYMRYELEPAYIDLENPLLDETIRDLRKLERRKKSKKNKDAAEENVDFDLVEQGVREVVKENLEEEDKQDSDDDYLDEYGNVKPDKEEDNKKKSVEKSSPKKLEKSSPKKFEKDFKKTSPKKFTRPANPSTYQDFDNLSSEDNRSPEKSKPVVQQVGLEEPRPSHLNRTEQKVYLELHRKFHSNSNKDLLSQDQEDFRVYRSYRDIVCAEQEEFQAFAREAYHFSGHYPLHSEARRYAEEHYKAQLSRVRTYPRLYEQCSPMMARLVPLSNEQQLKPQFEMRLEQTLLELGTILKIMIPKFSRIMQTENPLRVPSTYQKVEAKYPPQKRPSSSSSDISKDENANKLANMFPTDVVISSSALKAMFANFGQLSDDWEIPFVARQCGDLLVLFVDKPLTKKLGLTAHEKNVMFQRKAAKVLLLHPWSYSKMNQQKRSVHHHHQEVKSANIDDDDPFAAVDVDLSVLETFGSQLDGAADISSSSDDDEPKMVIAEDTLEDIPKKGTRASQKRVESTFTKRTTRSSTPSSTTTSQRRVTRSQATEEPKTPANRGRGRGKGKSPIERDSKKATENEDKKEKKATENEDKKDKKATEDEDEKEDHKATENEAKKATENEDEKDKKATETKDKEVVEGVKDDEEEEEEEIVRGTKKRKIRALHDDDLEDVAGHEQLNKIVNRSQRQREDQQQQNFLGNIMQGQKSMLGRKQKKFPPKQQQLKSSYHGEEVALAAMGDAKKDYQSPVTNSNVSYRRWILKPKSSSGGLRVVVRCATHGIRPETELQSYTVSTKLETQAHLGGDIMTKKELADDWLGTLLRPNSRLARVRVNMCNSDVLHVEKKTLKELSADGVEVGFRPAEALGNLFTLLSSIKTLVTTPGQYLIQHDANCGAFARVLKATEERILSNKSYDLHMAFSMARENVDLPAKPTWKPIDVNLVTPWHLRNDRVPALFEPPPQQQQQQQQSNNKKKKGQKWFWQNKKQQQKL